MDRFSFAGANIGLIFELSKLFWQISAQPPQKIPIEGKTGEKTLTETHLTYFQSDA
jgi:hypothetical protein